MRMDLSDNVSQMLSQISDEQLADIDGLVQQEKLRRAKLPLDVLLLTVVEEVGKYAKKGLNGQDYLTQSDDRLLIAVVGWSIQHGKRYADASLIVRIVDDWVVIERDQNDKPLVDALVQNGIPRRQIVLAYAGESVPELT